MRNLWPVWMRKVNPYRNVIAKCWNGFECALSKMALFKNLFAFYFLLSRWFDSLFEFDFFSRTNFYYFVFCFIVKSSFALRAIHRFWIASRFGVCVVFSFFSHGNSRLAFIDHRCNSGPNVLFAIVSLYCHWILFTFLLNTVVIK